ncbi:MAG: helix-turn-helix domain-containing protein [Bacteroidales bacterium]|nr:helix-turn-helix domain-containing protein [Bacteroidales bacterium]
MIQAKILENLVILEKLIRQEHTGTPKQLMKRLSISRSTLYRRIDELNSYGTKIKFCRTRNTFYYNSDEVIDILFNIKSTAEPTNPENKKT